MNNLLMHVASPDAKQLTTGTERFNIVLQQYPLQYQLSQSRMAKYIEKEDLYKHDRFVTSKTGTRIAAKYVGCEWRPGKEGFILFRDDKPVIENRFQEMIDNKEMGWFLKSGRETLGYIHKGTMNVLDKAQGKNGFYIANNKSAGTPKFTMISGQNLWSQMGGRFGRNKLKDFLTGYFTPRIVQQLPEGIWAPKGSFIHTEFIFYYPFNTLQHEDHAQDIDNHAYPYIKTFTDTMVELNVFKGDGPKYIRGYYAHYIEIENPEERRMEVKFHFCTNEQIIIPKLFLNPVNTLTTPEVDPL